MYLFTGFQFSEKKKKKGRIYGGMSFIFEFDFMVPTGFVIIFITWISRKLIN